MALGGGLAAALIACEDSPRVRTLDPPEVADGALDMTLDLATDAAPDQALDAQADLPIEGCVATTTPLDEAGMAGPPTACAIRPPNGCDQLATCVCEALGAADRDACVDALVLPRALINLSDSCGRGLDLAEVCRRDLWHMAAPGKFTIACSAACVDVPATLAER